MNPNWLAVLASGLMTAVVAELLRRRILRERFAILWLGVCAILMVLALVPALLTAASEALGFAVPSNLLFFAAIIVLLLVALQLSYEVSILESRTRRLAEEFALLADEVRGNVGRHPSPDRGNAREVDHGSR